MIEHRPFSTLGNTKTNWLNAKHHFSFGHYRNMQRDHWGALRVWNDDIIEPHTGFSPHPHDNMEIITYVTQGAISHKDSLGNEGKTEAGDVQVMSAGSGIIHSEYNHENEQTKLFQIWLIPETHNSSPSWGTAKFPKADRAGRFEVLASGFEGDEYALPIRVSARVLGATLEAGTELSYSLDGPNRFAYLVPVIGDIEVNGVSANARDGLAITDERNINIKALRDTEIVMVDAPTLI